MYSQSRRGVREHTHKYKLTKTLAVASEAIAGCEHIAETHIKGVESELRGIKSPPPLHCICKRELLYVRAA